MQSAYAIASWSIAYMPGSSRSCKGWKAQTKYGMYVCRLYISAIRMDTLTTQVTWDLDKTCKASNVSML
jgi:hypothetical protein